MRTAPYNLSSDGLEDDAKFMVANKDNVPPEVCSAAALMSIAISLKKIGDHLVRNHTLRQDILSATLPGVFTP